MLTLSPIVILQGQYVDGLRAPVTLHPQKEAYSYDEEFTVVLGDWYHQEHKVLLAKFISIAHPGGAEPVPSRHILISMSPFSRMARLCFDVLCPKWILPSPNTGHHT